MYKLVIIDDDQMLINGISKYVNLNGLNITLKGSANNGIDGLSLIKETSPDIVISDISMPGLSGLELLKELNLLYHMPLVILLTGHDNFHYAKEAISNNVFDYLTKPAFPQDIYASLKRAVVSLSSKTLYDEYELNYALKNNERLEIESCLNKFTENLMALNIYDINILQSIIFKFIKTYISKTTTNDSVIQLDDLWNDLCSLNTKEELILFLNDTFASFEPKGQSNITKIAERAKKYIDEDFKDPSLSIVKVADFVNISPNYLRTIFKKEYGMSFKNYITKIRMESAKKLIASGDYKIYEVSYMVGYKDVQQFRKTFKDYFGTLPSLI